MAVVVAFMFAREWDEIPSFRIDLRGFLRYRNVFCCIVNSFELMIKAKIRTSPVIQEHFSAFFSVSYTSRLNQLSNNFNGKVLSTHFLDYFCESKRQHKKEKPGDTFREFPFYPISSFRNLIIGSNIKGNWAKLLPCIKFCLYFSK